MKTKIVGICVCMLLIAAAVLPAAGTMNKRENRTPVLLYDKTSTEFAPGEFIVKLKKDTTFSKASLTALNRKHQVSTLEMVFPRAEGTILDDIYLLHVPMGSDILSLVREYTSCSDVVYAEPNWIVQLCGIPNDLNFSKQWYMHNTGQDFIEGFHGIPDADIDAPEAWDIEMGNSDVVIAIIDTGIDYTHPDLAAKIWNNTDETPGNGIDDDHNGYIDDIRGWDSFYNDSNVTDGHGHGTMCAGIAGASSNDGMGMAGVAWNCKIMPVRIFNAAGSTSIVKAAPGIRYAADNGADAISMSWTLGNSSTLRTAIDYAYGKGVFLCAAAGNNNNEIKMFPAAYRNVTAVGGTDHNDCRVTPENWGWGSSYGDWVDIAAPANLIYSTMPTYHVTFNDEGMAQNYDYGGGTSFASPMVAGVAALLLSGNPSLSPDDIKTLLYGNVNPYNSAEYIGTGRLNAQKALIALQFSGGIEIKGGLGVKMVITNNGKSDLTNITWEIHVDGGLYWMINKTKNGTIDIPAGESMTFKTGMLLGLGALSIRARIADIEKFANGTQLFVFSMVKK